jgi:hypothetical protein
MLSFANRKHVTVEKLEASRWELGSVVAADGTQFDFCDNNLLAGYHFRYRKMVAVAYRHVADNYVAVFGHFMPPGLWEGVASNEMISSKIRRGEIERRGI